MMGMALLHDGNGSEDVDDNYMYCSSNNILMA